MPIGLVLVLCELFLDPPPEPRPELIEFVFSDVVAHSIFLRFLLAALGVMNGTCY